VFPNTAEAALSPDHKTFALLRPESRSAAGYSLWFAKAGEAPQRYSLGPFHENGFAGPGYLAYAPNGQLGAWVTEHNGSSSFWVIKNPNTAPIQCLNQVSSEPRARTFAWLPDSSQIVFSGGRTDRTHLWLGNVESGAIREITTGTAREVAPAVSPNSDRIAFASTTATYAIEQIPTGSSVSGGKAAMDTTSARGVYSEMSPTWSPTRAEYAFATTRFGAPEIWLRDTRSGWERPLVTAKDFSDRSLAFLDVAFSPDGQRIAYRRIADRSEAIWISTLNGEGPVRIAHEPGDAFQHDPSWSPDGNWIAYTSYHSGSDALMKARADGSGHPVQVRLSAGVKPAWSPKGDVIATIADNGLILVNADGSAFRRLGDGVWFAITWSKNGDVLYGIRRSQHRHLEVATLDPNSGAESVRSELGSYPAAFGYGQTLQLDPVRGASISPDGKTFVTSMLQASSDLWLLSGYKK
jgi:Tol biopolymer transport system component